MRDPAERRRRRRPRRARWLEPPRRLRPTRAGWTFFLFTFGVGFAALNTGNNLLYLVLSLMLSFLVLSGVLSEAALRGITVRRRLPREIYAGAPAAIGLEIGNRERRIAALAVLVEDHVLDARGREWPAGRAFVLRVGPGERLLRSYRYRAERRGPLRFGRFSVSTKFPFGLFSKALRIDAPQSTLVYPAVDAVAAAPRLGDARDPGEGALGPRGTGCDVVGLRDFSPGDPIRRIHWPTSLRRETLVVRELESERESEVEIRLRTRGCPPGETFERAVRWAASEAVAFLEAGARVALRTDAERVPADSGAGQRARLLGFLARVAPGPATPA